MALATSFRTPNRRAAALGGLLTLAASCAKEAPPPRPAGLAPLTAEATAVSLLEARPAPPAWAPGAAASDDGGEMVPEPPPPSRSISGKIVLPRARRGDVARGDTIFIAARRHDGQPGPGSLLAAQRLQAGDFPLAFTLSARDAMIPGVPFEGTVSITVRVDKDGDPLTRRTGDVHGQAQRVSVGARGVTIALDTLQAEDITLAGSTLLDQHAAAGGPALPPGHPPLP